MCPVISIVGKSNSGKTTLLEKLIDELVRRGYNLAIIKHTEHDFDLDQPGKDSWRLAKASGGPMILSSAHKVAFIKPTDHEATLEELLHLIGEDFDLVLTEGFKSGSAPKIEVHRKELGELVCIPEELIAIVTDEPLDVDIPQYSPGDVEALADLIEKRASSPVDVEETLLLVNDTPIPLTPFIESFVRQTLLEMVSTLSSVEDVRSLHISLRRGQG